MPFDTVLTVIFSLSIFRDIFWAWNGKVTQIIHRFSHKTRNQSG